MATSTPGDVTRLLAEVAGGAPAARERLLEAIYNELHGLAAGLMRGERADHTLQPTALVHEAFLRMFGSQAGKFENRAHLFGAAAEAMRRILIDHARQRAALKRGGGAAEEELGSSFGVLPEALNELLAVDEALTLLEREDPRKAEIVKLRFYAGLSMEQIADVLEVAVITVKRDWRFARAWLGRRLQV
jgi:RNA polymerase sigma-70 factor (ECF subfamily)